jgi:ferredoxin-thioredoxin reductase catalytic subunit/glutaredoxin
MFDYIDFEFKPGIQNKGDLKLFGLSTCGFCRRAIKFLEENEIQFNIVYLNEIDLSLKLKAKEEFKEKFNAKMSFPTIVINEEDYQIGFIRIAWERAFGTEKSKPERSINDPKRQISETSKFVDASAKYKKWYVNWDNDFRQKLEEGLLTNYNKYGFYHCPCRESDGSKSNNDIACPCRYAEKDIKEWGQCFCGLYVSEEFYKNKVEPGSIPERREDK